MVSLRVAIEGQAALAPAVLSVPQGELALALGIDVVTSENDICLKK